MFVILFTDLNTIQFVFPVKDTQFIKFNTSKIAFIIKVANKFTH